MQLLMECYTQNLSNDPNLLWSKNLVVATIFP